MPTLVPDPKMLQFSSDSKLRLGDEVWGLARGYADQVNARRFFTELRQRRVTRDQYVRLLCTLYPLVVGFNRALIRSMAKVDHVRQPMLVRALAEQLLEEQLHNEMWRRKLEVFGVDHDAVYGKLAAYLAEFTAEDLDRMTSNMVAVLGEDLTALTPGVFPEAPFPEPVLALYHHLWTGAVYGDVDYWEQFASQSSIEVIIYDVVSNSVYPGVSGNPQLDLGPVTVQWWREHARQGSTTPGHRTDEEKHLELAMITLNRTQITKPLARRVRSRAEETMRLFAAALFWQDRNDEFPIEPYMRD